MYTPKETLQIADTIHKQLIAMTPMNVLMSWGIEQFAYTTYREMPTLVVTVNGFLHKGPVFISYNRGEDLYEVRTVKNHTKEVEVLKTQLDVYADMLGDVIDRMVEKDCSQEEYERRIDEFLAS